jgi:type I restriction-modification system DNA methylase subunit
MPKPTKKAIATRDSGANLGFEAQLWQTANALRGSMEAAEYKHVILDLILMPRGVAATTQRQPPDGHLGLSEIP